MNYFTVRLMFSCFFGDFNGKSVASKFFLLIDYYRHLFYTLIVAFFYAFPLYTLGVLFACEIGFIIFVLVVRPFQNKKLMLLTILEECLTMGIMACFALIALEDLLGNKTIGKRVTFSLIIIYLNIAMISLILFCGVVEVCKALKRKMK